MSKPISKEAYEKRFINRALKWIKGEVDPYEGNVEVQIQG